MKKNAILFVALLVLGGIAVWIMIDEHPGAALKRISQKVSLEIGDEDAEADVDAEEDALADDEDEEEDEEECEEEEPLSESEKAEEAWDALLDRYYEKYEDQGTPTASEVKAFKQAFDALAEEDKDLHITEAQNLLGDNALNCLEAVLFDKQEPEEILSSVFNDIVGRDDEVKMPIVRRIAADPEHPLNQEALDLLIDVDDEETRTQDL